MPRIFNRVITFHIQGEIYDNETTPESIIKKYDWTMRSDRQGNIQIVASHDDNRGRIVEATRLPKIHPWHKPDTELFLV